MAIFLIVGHAWLTLNAMLWWILPAIDPGILFFPVLAAVFLLARQ